MSSNLSNFLKGFSDESDIDNEPKQENNVKKDIIKKMDGEVNNFENVKKEEQIKVETKTEIKIKEEPKIQINDKPIEKVVEKSHKIKLNLNLNKIADKPEVKKEESIKNEIKIDNTIKTEIKIPKKVEKIETKVETKTEIKIKEEPKIQINDKPIEKVVEKPHLPNPLDNIVIDGLFSKTDTPIEYKDKWVELYKKAHASEKNTLTNNKVRNGKFRFNKEDGRLEILPEHEIAGKSSKNLLKEIWINKN